MAIPIRTIPPSKFDLDPSLFPNLFPKIVPINDNKKVIKPINIIDR